MELNHIWTEEITPRADRDAILAFAIHNGHHLRDDVAELVALSEADRLREEDPFTAEWVAVAPTQVVGLVSRFQVDLNRPRANAVYQTPHDAWGLTVWKRDPPSAVTERSLAEYDDFYTAMETLLGRAAERFGRFVVLDIHSYNHRRAGADAPPAEPVDNPQVNVGTGTMDRGRWGGVVDRFVSDLRAYPFPGGALDVRENVRFRGGYFSEWVHQAFPESACALAIEFKKTFMDEWTGEPDPVQIDAIREALASTVPGVLQEIART